MELLPATYNLGAILFACAAIFSLFLSVYLIRPYRWVYLTMIAVPVIAGASYYMMGQGMGMITTNTQMVNLTRYADWILTTPLLLFALLYAMYPNVTERWKQFFIIAALDITMLVTGLGAELTDGNVRTVLFSVSSLSFLSIVYLIVDRLLVLNLVFDNYHLRRSVLILAWIVVILWSLYPFIWIFGPSGLAVLNTIGEAQLYLLLDIITKTGFNIFLLQFLYLGRNITTTQHE